MQEIIDSCHKESESCVAYPDQNTANFNIVANITVKSDSITSQKTKNCREEDHQEYFKIPFDENKANKSIIASKNIESNASETIEQFTNIKLNKLRAIILETL